MHQSPPPIADVDIHVLVVAAGQGARFGANIPKQYVPINGFTVLRHTLNALTAYQKIASIRCIIDPTYADTHHDTIMGLDIGSYVAGGATRQQSVHNGLKAIAEIAAPDDIVLIHDAARPMISANDLDALINGLDENRAASLASPISATLRRSVDGGICGDTVARDGLWAMQTPQGFRYADILQAHERAEQHSASDDTSLISALGIDVKIVQGCASNIKITTQDDLNMVERLLMNTKTNAKTDAKTQTRTGLGFDVHAFDMGASGPLRIGGIDIDHDHPLKGHSDADVALHTITDAILGAIGEGDIGQHFSPSDNSFKNMDSAIFLTKACDMLREKGAVINNIDLTIICERPKIGSHAPNMRQRIAQILDIGVDQVNIKATTTERLGFTGRGEGIAAQAIATVEIPA